ncbi:MAG: hypothetical protein NVV73_13470 [Cellvibrionaceae bacterium]|nr:hypothetical protein [Cellvibrionaceae bacterium]
MSAREENGNLEHPVPGLHEEHGRFGAEAKESAISVTQDAVEYSWIFAGIGLVGIIAGAMLGQRALHRLNYDK